MNEIELLILALSYLALAITVPLILFNRRLLNGKNCRNIIRLLTGITIFSLYYITNTYYLRIIPLVMTIIFLMSRKNTPLFKYLFNAIAENDEKTKGYLEGMVIYALSLTILTYIYMITNDALSIIVSALVLIISDPVAALIGKKYGSIKLGNRTLQGSIAMFCSTLAILLFTYQLSINIVLISAIIPLIELLSPSKFDNITLPLSTVILLLLL